MRRGAIAPQAAAAGSGVQQPTSRQDPQAAGMRRSKRLRVWVMPLTSVGGRSTNDANLCLDAAGGVRRDGFHAINNSSHRPVGCYDQG